MRERLRRLAEAIVLALVFRGSPYAVPAARSRARRAQVLERLRAARRRRMEVHRAG